MRRAKEGAHEVALKKMVLAVPYDEGNDAIG